MYYGDQRESMVNICHTLQDLGWVIFGYKPDKSDSMTDYFDHARWDGVATKNGYVLCVDAGAWRVKDSGKEIYDYQLPSVTFKTSAKIKQLQCLAEDSGATPGEKSAALAAIERVKAAAQVAVDNAKASRVLISTWPTFQQNPPHCNWHIEKDNVIVAKGRGAFQFHNLPSWVDLMTGDMMEDRYISKAWQLNDENKKDIAKFQAFIRKVEGVVSTKIGDGDADTEYETVTVTEYKVENKAVSNSSLTIEIGADFVLLGNFNYGCIKGLVYHIENIVDGRIRSHKYNGKLNKLCTGNANRNNSFNCMIDKMELWISNGSIAMCDIVSEKTPYEVQKCIKKKSMTKKFNSAHTFDVTEDTDTRNGSRIYLVKVLEKLSKDEYVAVNQQMRSLGGYYSKFKHAFLFKENPSEILSDGIVPHATGTIPNKPISKKEKVPNTSLLLAKINKQIESNEKNVEKLSGNYQTNTYKRMREQDSRDSKIRGYRFDIELLTYLAGRLEDTAAPLTALEATMIENGAFRDSMGGYCNRHVLYNSSDRPSASMEIEFPTVNKEWGADNWWNKEVPKLTKRLNKAGIYNTSDLILAAESYGEMVQRARKPVDQTALKIKKMERECKMMQKGDINFTPPSVVQRLVEMAHVTAGDTVLEPSAGIGAIADAIRDVTDKVDVVEQMSNFRELLQLKGHNLVGDDFLQYDTENQYDAIVANPPFSEEQKHIRHMFELLKPGGTLVTISSPHWTFAKDKKSVEFRDWVELQNSYTEDLESGTFEMTGVASKILVIEKAS